jgi:dihydropteroate synthase
VIARPLAAHSARAVKELLLARGWDAVKADAAAGALRPAAVELVGLDEGTLLALVRHAGQLGVDLLTGEDWAVVSGSEARLSALARPWVVPAELAQVADLIGRALPPEAAAHWITRRGSLPLAHPLVMGILNLTPDSFSDGGRYLSPDQAMVQADRLLAEGADLLDLGGESTRPGSEAVPEAEERARVVPVVDALARRHPGVTLSVDTVKSGVARAALDVGAAIINDVSGGRLDPAMAATVARAGAGFVIMHSRGTVSTMARLDHAEYVPDVVSGVREELALRLEAALAAGLTPDQVVLDPGFGFAKTAEQNLLLCDRLAALLPLGRPLLVGPSRKRFLGSVTGREVAERDVATAAACVVAFERGARIFRVHNVALTRDALAVAFAVRGGD